MAPAQISDVGKERLLANLLTAYTDMNGHILIAGAELEQKLMWGTTHNTRAGAIQAVCLETGFFMRCQVLDKAFCGAPLRMPFPYKLKLRIEIELIPRHE